MLTHNFSAIEFGGYKFDRGMNLFEFDTIRAEYNADLASYTGEYKDSGRFGKVVEDFIRSQIEVTEIPSPKMMLSTSDVVADVCISNYFGELDGERIRKMVAEAMSRKILGIEYKQIAPGYYRAGWLPPPVLLPTLRPVKFHYPKAGYFGALAEKVGISPHPKGGKLDTTQINIAYLTGFPSVWASVLFVVKESPIYRITNQEMCAGTKHNVCRLVVEFRGECDVIRELARLGVCYSSVLHGQTSANLALPIASNLEKQPTLFTNSLNDQIIRSLRAKSNP